MWLLVLRHWKGVAAGLLLAAVVAGVLYYGHTKYTAGKQDGKTAQVMEDSKLYEAQIQQRDALLKQTQQQAAEYASLADQYAKTAAGLGAQLTSLRNQSTAASKQVASVADDRLFTDIRAKLGQQPPDAPAVFTSGELREIDVSVTQLPIAQQELDAAGKQADSLDREIAAVRFQLAAEQEQTRVWKQFALEVQAHYIQAYNALPRHRNWFLSIMTFGIKGKSAAKLKLPNPDAIIPPKSTN